MGIKMTSPWKFELHLTIIQILVEILSFVLLALCQISTLLFHTKKGILAGCDKSDKGYTVGLHQNLENSEMRLEFSR